MRISLFKQLGVKTKNLIGNWRIFIRKDEQAVENVLRIARYNCKESDLTVADFQRAAAMAAARVGRSEGDMETSAKAAALKTVEKLSLDHVKALFATRKLVTTSKGRPLINLSATANRIFGVTSPLITLKADLGTPTPIYTSGALFLGAGFVALLLPFETRGKASL